ncbi:serine/threonine-protein kinase [Oscillatoria salina]|uniref:serine/threonine-protein kinase n=1 Tax=Oscillatoria salina TaxID=331517 RepID=UPI0013BC2A93|nr:serine/threonine-protein kinase [Oscillatoria salina]MBZ8182977.1 protein kinase [Oscillatoria salina IIICB1]NET86517.1 protein kinase [Kamptonema sp. SIO1D9]
MISTQAGEIPPGKKVNDRYEIIKVIGQGGFGRTYLISDRQRFEEKFVLKEFLHSHTNTKAMAKFRELFEREAKVLHQLKHQQIPQFLAWFEEEGKLFLVQEYIQGKSYSEFLVEGKTFSEAEIKQWLLDLLPVLDYIHDRGIIHRDISPDNIIWCSDRQKPVLIDFGVVKEAIASVTHLPSSPLTRVGKPGYSPPEQLYHGQSNATNDLYSLAVTALVLFTRKDPSILFDTSNFTWNWQNYVNVNNNFAQIIQKMLANAPEDRYQSAREVISALEKLNLTPTLSPDLPVIKTSGTILQPAAKIPGKPIAFTCLATILIAGVVVFAKNLGGLCNIFNNCPVENNEEIAQVNDLNFTEVYNQAVAQANAALAETPQSIAELAEIHSQLDDAINQLENLPAQDEELLISYQNKLQEIGDRLTKEQEAEKKFSAAEALAVEADRQTNVATTISELEAAQRIWEAAQTKLDEIDSDTYIRENVKSKNAEYQEKIAKLADLVRQKQLQSAPSVEKLVPEQPTPKPLLDRPFSPQETPQPPRFKEPPELPVPPPSEPVETRPNGCPDFC